MTYKQKIEKCTELYPFGYWLEDFQDGLGVYSEENCNIVKQIFDDLIKSLCQLDKDSSDIEKENLIKASVGALNDISSIKPELIKTMEREEFCDLFDEIANSAGLDISRYEDGIASKWRSW